MYTDKVMDHFLNPRNAVPMEEPDAMGRAGDPACGDALIFFLRVEDGTIRQASYLVFGCCASIATASMTSVLVQGKTLEEALAVTEEDVLVALDGLPPGKVHCSNLGVEALRSAIRDYRKGHDGKVETT